MPHKTTWLVPKRLILMKMDGEVNVQLMAAVNRDFFAYIEEGEAPVHLLVDARGVTKINFQVKDLSVLLAKQDERFGANFVITENRFARFIITMAEHLTGSHYRAVTNAHDALSAFSRFDAQLPANLHEQADFVDNF